MGENIIQFFTQWNLSGLISGIIVIAGVIIFAGSKLSKLGDEISEVSGLSSSWIGLIFLATITSIPELATSITAAITGSPNIAVGNIFGSNMFNMLIIAILDFLQGPGPVMLSVSATQILPASHGVFLMALAATGIFASDQIQTLTGNPNDPFATAIGFVFSAFILLGWIVGAIIIFNAEKATVSDEKFFKIPDKKKLRNLILKFTIAAIAVIISGIILIGLATAFANTDLNPSGQEFKLGGSIVGTIIVAIITSLPELVVAISAYKIGAMNMAVANIFGSNTYNMLLFPIMDIIMRKSVIASVDSTHIITASFGIILISIAIMGVIYRSRKSFLYLGWDALAILAFYVAGIFIFSEITFRMPH